MKVIILFTALVATLASASVFEQFSDFVKAHSFTKEEAAAIAAKHKFKKIDNIHHERAVNESQHRIRARREKYGLPNPVQGPNVQNMYQSMEGGISVLLGAAEGLMYHMGVANRCYNAIEGSLLSFESFGPVFMNIYLPWYWTEAMISIMDSVTMSADFYSSCDVDKLMTTCTKLITVEGASELASRAAGAIFFQYMDLIKAFEVDEDTGQFVNSSYVIGRYVGRAVSVTFAWTI